MNISDLLLRNKFVIGILIKTTSGPTDH